MYFQVFVKTAASYRGRTKVKISRYTLISNLSYMHNMRELHDANQYKGFVNGSDKVNYSKTIKYTFSTILYFREMSKQNVIADLCTHFSAITSFSTDFLLFYTESRGVHTDHFGF